MFHHNKFQDIIEYAFNEYMSKFQSNRYVLDLYGDLSDEKLNEYDLEIRKIDTVRQYVRNLMNVSEQEKSDAYLKIVDDITFINNDIILSQEKQLKDTNSNS